MLAALGALAALVFGAAVTLALLVVGDLTRAPGALAGGVPFPVLAAVATATAAGVGACVGLAAVPARVASRGGRATFAAGSALVAVAALFALPTMLACYTWPAAAAALVGAGALFRRAVRGPGRE